MMDTAKGVFGRPPLKLYWLALGSRSGLAATGVCADDIVPGRVCVCVGMCTVYET